MPEPRNLLIGAVSVVVLILLGYMLVHMIRPDPYAETIVSHLKYDNSKAASQTLATIKADPKCARLDVSRDSLQAYYKSQECFMLKTEMQTRHGPTDAELSARGKAFIAGISSKLKMCMAPAQQDKLVQRIDAGKNFKFFLYEIDRSRDEAGKLERIGQMMKCSS